MRTVFLIAFCIVLYEVIQAQTIDEGKKCLIEQQWNCSKTIFQKLVSKDTTNAEAWFSLGETYLQTDNSDSALYCFQKGINGNPKYAFNYAGIGKIYFQQNKSEEAKDDFEKARKTDKKNVKLMVYISDAAFSGKVKDTSISMEYFALAKKITTSSPDYYLRMGDLWLMLKRNGDAANEYKRASDYDKKNTEAYNKYGDLYANAYNFNEAYQAYHNSINLDSTQILVYKKLGDICWTFGKYDEARLNYEKYLSRAEISVEDEEKYALILFFTKDYPKAEDALKEVIKKQPGNPVLYRIRGYIAYETGNYTDGLTYMKKLFELQKPEKILPSDYDYIGKLYEKNNQDSLAIVNLLKAVEQDSAKYFPQWKDIAELYSKNSDNLEAIKYYSLLQSTGAVDKASVSFLIGKEYFFHGNKFKSIADTCDVHKKKKMVVTENCDSTRRIGIYYLSKADSCFGVTVGLSTKSYQGFLWRARTRLLLIRKQQLTVPK